MLALRSARWLCSVGLIVGLAVTACGGDDDDDGAATGGAAGSGGASGSGGKSGSGGNAGSGGMAGEGSGGMAGEGSGGMAGSGGDAGTGGVVVVVPENPHTGMGLVAGGGYAKSETFVLFYTLGDQPGANGVMQSENHQLTGGIVGVTH